MSRFLDYLYIVFTIAFTVFGQIIFKWRIAKLEPAPIDFLGKVKFLFFVIFDPVIFSGFDAAFLASFTWMAAMTKFDLSHAYPFMSLNFAVVLLLSNQLLGEAISTQKLLGIILIMIGTIISARG